MVFVGVFWTIAPQAVRELIEARKLLKRVIDEQYSGELHDKIKQYLGE
jgi:hypothetical protein